MKTENEVVELLEKCATKTTVSIRRQTGGKFYIWADSGSMDDFYVFGETLPLAVAKLHKQLFSK